MKRNDADKEAKVLFPLIVAVGRNSTFSKFQQENFSQLLFELIFNRKEKKKKGELWKSRRNVKYLYSCKS